jgi:hypothetical protein
MQLSWVGPKVLHEVPHNLRPDSFVAGMRMKNAAGLGGATSVAWPSITLPVG